MARIPVLVQQGLDAEAIAARLGCNVSTLRVRCSQAQISLRVPKEVKVVPLVPAPTPPKPPKQPKTPKQKLASDLLEMIAQDDLYDAVLDRVKDA